MRSRAATLVALSYRACLLLAAGCSGAHEPTQTQPLPTPPRASLVATTNVPALLGKSIDSLRSELGPAQVVQRDFIDSMVGNIAPVDKVDSLATFRSGGLTLVASYNVRTRRVRDLLVLGRHEDSLMARASLQANARNYLIMPVFFATKPSHLLGLRIVSLQ